MLTQSELESQTRGLATRLGLSEVVGETAAGLAGRALATHPINRAPSSIAAASIYLSGLQHGEHASQAEVAAVADTTPVSIRATYPEIAYHEDIDLPHNSPTNGRGGRPPTSMAYGFETAHELTNPEKHGGDSR